MRCPICGGSSVRSAYAGVSVRSEWKDGARWSVKACDGCGHRFLDPAPGPAQLAAYYDSGYAPYADSHGMQASFDAAVAAARASGVHRHVAIRPGMRLLDVGCGGGAFLRVARALGADAEGVEPSAHGVESCRRRGIPVFHGDLTAFVATDPAPFDLITANHVIEHHPDPVRFLREMRSLLAPGGRIWISAPNAGCFFARALRDRWHSSDLPVHLQHFSAASMRLAFERAGIEVDRFDTESENSLAGSLATLLRARLAAPGRVTRALFGRLLAKNGLLGGLIDRSGEGEAILAEGRVAR